jgi:hypothetical protein
LEELSKSRFKSVCDLLKLAEADLAVMESLGELEQKFTETGTFFPAT